MRLIQLSTTDSTNSYLRQLVERDPTIGDYTIVSTIAQTAGRGQRGNGWESAPGQNLTISILLRPVFSEVSTLFDISRATALAVRDVVVKALEGVCAEEEVEVKWPNDILVRGQKIAGILIENDFAGSTLDTCIVGIGLNVCQRHFGDYYPPAVSLSLLCNGRDSMQPHMWHSVSSASGVSVEVEGAPMPPDHQCLIIAIAHRLRYYMGAVAEDPAELRSAYHRKLYRHGLWGESYATAEGRPMVGTLVGVTAEGRLCIDEDTGEQHRFAFKEVCFCAAPSQPSVGREVGDAVPEPSHVSSRTARVAVTADGSPTLLQPEIMEHYHSMFGARTESQYIYVEHALRAWIAQHSDASECSLLEIGMGSGLNALLTLLEVEAAASTPHITYHTYERYPLTTAEYESYAAHLTSAYEQRLCSSIHRAPWDRAVRLSPRFSLYKHLGDATELPLPECDVVYMDAFSPDHAPELWSHAFLSKLSTVARREATLSTYCAKGAIRRMLQQLGWTTSRTPGPPMGKREILTALFRVD